MSIEKVQAAINEKAAAAAAVVAAEAAYFAAKDAKDRAQERLAAADQAVIEATNEMVAGLTPPAAS